MSVTKKTLYLALAIMSLVIIVEFIREVPASFPAVLFAAVVVALLVFRISYAGMMIQTLRRSIRDIEKVCDESSEVPTRLSVDSIKITRIKVLCRIAGAL
jgi:hypothetical protein